MSRLNELSAVAAAAEMAAGRLTAEHLTRACLERIAERENDVRAWAYLSPDRVIAEARARDREPRRGPLHGMPIAVKDVMDTADMPTEYGTPIYKGNQPACDAVCVARAREAGAVVLGKTVSTELANIHPAGTRNPRNLGHTPGGSSSGSAAAVADCMVPLAFGTQTGGSLIRPASYCGIVGYKPTFDFISTAGVKALSASLDTVGVYGRTVPDAALTGRALIGFAPLDFEFEAGGGAANRPLPHAAVAARRTVDGERARGLRRQAGTRRRHGHGGDGAAADGRHRSRRRRDQRLRDIRLAHLRARTSRGASQPGRWRTSCARRQA